MATPSGDSHSRLCDRCLEMCSNIENLRALTSEKGYTHSRLADFDLISRGPMGCELCILIRRLSNLGDYWHQDFKDGEFHWSAVEGRPHQTLAPDRVLAPFANNRFGELNVKGPNPFSINFNLFAFARKGDPAAPFTNAPFEIPASGAEMTGIILERLKVCRSSHVECMASELQPLPTRLIDVSGKTLKLITTRTGSNRAKGEYVALSYCWGRAQTFITTITTLEEKERGFLEESLPQTLKDAVSTTRNLGFQYLWVDALCIIQDSDKDKDAEIAVMGDVYLNSALTIVAANASDVEKGFLLPQKSVASRIRLPMVLPDDGFGTLSLLPYENEVVPKPLYTRGWAFQEFMLSRRLLIFEQDSFLQCRKIRTHEDSVLLPSNIQPITWGPRNPTVRLPGAIFGDVGEAAASNQKQIWWNMAERYSQRHLTSWSDRFVAIAGIARELQKLRNVGYFAGLWEDTMIEDLAWKRVQTWNDRRSDTHELSIPTFISPTWSWISFGGDISPFPPEYETLTSFFAKFVRCEVTCEDNSPDPFGRIIGGRLTLNACLMSVQELLFHRMFGGWCKHFCLDRVDIFSTLFGKAGPSGIEHRITRSRAVIEDQLKPGDCFMPLGWYKGPYSGHDGSGLFLRKQDDETYRRIGQMTFQSTDASESEVLALDHTEVILI